MFGNFCRQNSELITKKPKVRKQLESMAKFMVKKKLRLRLQQLFHAFKALVSSFKHNRREALLKLASGSIGFKMRVKELCKKEEAFQMLKTHLRDQKLLEQLNTSQYDVTNGLSFATSTNLLVPQIPSTKSNGARRLQVNFFESH